MEQSITKPNQMTLERKQIELLAESSERIQSGMQRVQMSLPKTSITKVLTDRSPLCSTDPVRMVKYFSYVIKVYFGINPDILPQEKNENGEDRNIIISLACKTLLEKYPAMTFEKLNLSYSEEQTDKKQGVSLTIDELMLPLALFWRKCEFIRIESEKIKRELDEANEIEAKKQAHKDESIRLYIECVNGDGVWKGTPFQANVFAKESFAHKFTQPEKDELYAEAKKKVKEIEARRNLALIDSIAFNEPVPDAVQMFSQLVVIEACKRGFEIIVG